MKAIIKIIKANIRENKLLTFMTLLMIIISSTIILVISMMFSSIREYLITEVKQTYGSHHVICNKTYIKKSDYIKSIKVKDYQSYITFNNPTKAYDLGNKLCDKPIYNNQLLALYGVTKNNVLEKMLILIFVIISLFSFLVIKNTFDIKNNLCSKNFSILNILGMTRKRIVLLNILESLCYLIVGFLISIFISIFFSKIIVNLFNKYLVGTINLEFKIYYNFFLAGTLFIIITILISAIIPAIKINKKNINKYINNYNSKKIRHKKFFLKFIGIEGMLAYINYKKDKKRYKTISRCIWIGISVFILFYLIFSYINKTINSYVVKPNYDGEIQISEKYNLDKFVKENNLKKYLTFNSCFIKTKISKNDLYNKDNYHKNVNIMLVNYDRESTFLINKIKESAFKNDKLVFYDNPVLKHKITLKLNDKEIKNVELKEKYPKYLNNYLTSKNIVVNVPNIEDYCQVSTNLIYEGNVDVNKLGIEANFFDAKKSLKIIAGIILAIKTLMFTFIAFIIFLIFTTIVSTSASNLDIRKKELGILKTLGFTNDKLQKMMFWESIFICLKGILIGLFLTIFINKFVYYSVSLVIDIDYISNMHYFIRFSIYCILLVFGTLLFVLKYLNNRKPIHNINVDT